MTSKAALFSVKPVLRNLLCLVFFIVASHGVQANDVSVADSPTSARAVDGNYIHWIEQRIDDEALAGIAVRGAGGFEVADFDRDGKLDMAIMYEDSNQLRIAFGGDSAEDWETVTNTEGVEVQEIEDGAVGDLNGDG